jgi:hypothetical protein
MIDRIGGLFSGKIRDDSMKNTIEAVKIAIGAVGASVTLWKGINKALCYVCQ